MLDPLFPNTAAAGRKERYLECGVAARRRRGFSEWLAESQEESIVF
jgi:hypothetical protein